MISNKNDEFKNTIIIACYRRPYDKQSLESIRGLLKRENPDKVIVLSISEIKKSRLNVKSYLGTRDIKKFKDKLAKDQRLRSSRYTDKIIDICRKLNIDCKKIEEKGKASDIIIEKAKENKPSHIVIHESDKSKIDKMLSGSVSDEVCRESICVVTILK